MNTQGNTYTFIYASVMVILVAAGLAFTAIKLKPYQDANIKNEKMQNILSSVGIQSTPENVNGLYAKYITESLVINTKGEVQTGKAAFDIELNTELAKPIENRDLPVFKCTQEDGTVFIIVPLRGKGLWGPIWGYMSFEKDFNTIHGAVFDHKGETPGLGADINQPWFYDPFKGKTVFNENGELVSIAVYKGGKGAAQIAGDTKHGVDGISGGTITSKGLEAMIKDCLVNYETYFKNSKSN
ncbi:MAG TPA: NADH:ubiquinone reductase (Na(+)-transporting) subunit C [Bacteroidales bacterium]|nr:NADH:ubiquinone reductase (Na(+)-transporting) subunit C [Bacteroidales bacterium]